MIRFLTLVSLALTALPTTAFASAAFDYGHRRIQGLRELRDLHVGPIEFRHEALLGKLRRDRAELERQRLACSTFECADEVVARIKPLEADLQVAELARGEEIAAADLPYELAARELLLQVYFLTLTETLAADPTVQHLKTRSLGKCGKIERKGFTYDALKGPHLCRELALDFKQGEKFYRLSLAAGTVRKHFGWDGRYEPSLSQTGLAEVERILSTPGWLERHAKAEQVLEGSKRAVTFYRTGGYMLGGTSDLGVVLVAREER